MANIIETSANQFFFVRDLDDESLAHVWEGIEVKRVKGGWETKAKAKPILVRKAGCTVIAA